MSYLAIPQVVFCLGPQQKDIIGVQGGGESWNLYCFGVGFVVALNLEESYWRVGPSVSLSGSPTLERRRAESGSQEHHMSRALDSPL